jgi:hypothetical protein
MLPGSRCVKGVATGLMTASSPPSLIIFTRGRQRTVMSTPERPSVPMRIVPTMAGSAAVTSAPMGILAASSGASCSVSPVTGISPLVLPPLGVDGHQSREQTAAEGPGRGAPGGPRPARPQRRQDALRGRRRGPALGREGRLRGRGIPGSQRRAPLPHTGAGGPGGGVIELGNSIHCYSDPSHMTGQATRRFLCSFPLPYEATCSQGRTAPR